MFTIPAVSAYFVLGMMVFLAFILVYWWNPEQREQMNWMSFWGAWGGVLISQLYRQDFWNPPSISGFHLGPLFVTIEDFIFGGAFIGIVAVLVPVEIWWFLLEAEPVQSVPRWKKFTVILGTLLLGAILSTTGANSMGVTIPAFFLGAILICGLRPDLLKVALLGGVLSWIVYAVLVGGFVVIIAGNADDLGRAFSPHYVRYGMKTAATLSLWAFAFGACFAPFYAFIANKRYTVR